jgi:hypothetical protein
MIDSQVRNLPLTPSFPCNDREFQDRVPLYAAFSAAKGLLTEIQTDAESFVKSPPLAIPPTRRRFPNIQSLLRFPNNKERIQFHIIESLGDHVPSRLVYVANTSNPNPKTILLKFSRKYGKDLHQFCAKEGWAPALLAFEELFGGWVGVAMEYFPSAPCVDESPLLQGRGGAWIDQMGEMIKKIHLNGYVHGDLRPPNFIVEGGRLLLVDFDWGGKEGHATFPDIPLLPILREGRRAMKITQQHDNNVLADTIRQIKEKIGWQSHGLAQVRSGFVHPQGIPHVEIVARPHPK